MATAPAYAANPRSIDGSDVSTVNTNRDGTGTIATVATGSAAGFRVAEVVIHGEGSTSAGSIVLYLSTDSGSTWNIFDEIPTTSVGASSTVAAFHSSRKYDNLVLTGTSNRLGAATTVTQTVRCWALGADL